MYFVRCFQQFMFFVSLTKESHALDKIYYLSKCATYALSLSKELLNDKELFKFEFDELLEECVPNVYGRNKQMDEDEEEEEQVVH